MCFYIGVVGLSIGCSGGGGSSGSITPAPPPSDSGPQVKVNQIGYLPDAEKVAIVPDTGATTFSVVNVANNSVAYQGNLTDAAVWSPSDR